MKKIFIYIFLILILFITTNKLFSQDKKGKMVYITIDKSGSMNNGLSKDILGSIHTVINQLVLGNELKNTELVNIITDNKKEINQFLKIYDKDIITIYHYGSKVLLCEKNINSKNIDYISKCLPDTTNFPNFFNEKLSIMYLPEMEILKNFNLFFEHYWIDLSDRRPDDTKDIPSDILKEWDNLHIGINAGNIVLRIRFQNGIYLTMTKIEYTHPIDFQVKSNQEANQIKLLKISADDMFVELESEPFRLIHLANHTTLDIKNLTFQTITYKQEKVEFHTNIQQTDQNKIVVKGKISYEKFANILNFGIITFQYKLGNSYIEEKIPNVSFLIEEPKKFNSYLIFGLLSVCFLFILFLLYLKKFKNLSQEKINVLNIKISAPQEGLIIPEIYKVSMREKIAFEKETATTQRCIGCFDIRMSDQYIELTSIPKKEFEFINKREHGKNKIVQLPCEIELRNKFGKTIKIKIEELIKENIKSY